jgi:hypothetical protein
VEEHLAEDIRRIRRAHAVAEHAKELLEEMDADATLTLSAAYLHDIGIHEAERKHGASAGRYRRQAAKAVARPLLEQLNAPAEFIDRVCELIAADHRPGEDDSPELRILVDAEALVDLAESLPGKDNEQVEELLQRSLVTEAGLKKGREIYLT